MVMDERPLEITLLAGLTITVAVVRLLLLAAVALMPEVRQTVDSFNVSQAPNAIVQVPLLVHYLISALGVIVFLIGGVGLLRAWTWSRGLLLVWTGWGLLFAFLTTGSLGYITPDALVFGLLLVVLFSPRAGRYFRVG